MIVRLAVWVSIALEEVAGAQFLSAMCANEVLGMPGLSQSSDDLAHDGFLASVAASLLGGVDSLAAHVCL